MHSIDTMHIALWKKRTAALPAGQLSALFFLLAAGSAIILETMREAALITVLLLLCISVAGLLLCKRSQVQLGDPALKILGYFWLIKLGATLFLLYTGWIPELDLASAIEGYDPQRYYIQAKELIDNNWSTSFISLNYVGILYYYGIIFYALGHNPVIPALGNAFITLTATLYLIKTGYEIKVRRGPRDWTLAFALLLPEILWFDVMTSRETLMATLLVFALLTVGRYLAGTASISQGKVLATCTLSVLAIAAVRTSVVLPTFTAIVLMVLSLKVRHRSRLKQITIMIFAAAMLFAGPIVNSHLGGDEFDVSSKLQRLSSSEGNVAENANVHWSENSIGMLLFPSNMLQSFLFLLPRMMLYLAAPLPNAIVPINDLISNSWSAWQKLLTLLSSLINVFAMPYILASLLQSVKMRRTDVAPLIFHISYWITFIGIAGGNLIIHERYRIMATLLMWGCSWLGARTCSRYNLRIMFIFWYGLLGSGALFYIGYKFGFA